VSVWLVPGGRDRLLAQGATLPTHSIDKNYKIESEKQPNGTKTDGIDDIEMKLPDLVVGKKAGRCKRHGGVAHVRQLQMGS
jgi:hypothetical protein